MSINKFRFIQSGNDGWAFFECLKCYGKWAGESEGFCYCHFCGTKWEDQLVCRDHHTPRWAWDKWGEEWYYQRPDGPNIKETFFEIQTRMVWGKDVHDWKKERTVRFELGCWKKLKSALVDLRHEPNEYYKIETRILNANTRRFL
jgi:hypothetical protein